MFTQSNFGIVTKMGFWLMPNPGGYKPFLITVPKKEDLHELVERIRPLRISMVIQNAPTIRHVLLDAACMKTKSEWLNGEDRLLTEEDEYKIAEELDIGYWGFYGALYGPPPMQDMLWHVIWGSLSQIEGAKHYFEGKAYLSRNYFVDENRLRPSCCQRPSTANVTPSFSCQDFGWYPKSARIRLDQLATQRRTLLL